MAEDVAKYRGTVVAGNRWRRAWRVTMQYPHGGPVVVQFDEEQITDIEGVVTAKPTETLSLTFAPNGEIPIYDPATGEKTGETVRQRVLFSLLYSAYRMVAAARDERASP